MTRKIGLILALTLAILLSGLAPARAVRPHRVQVSVSTERHVGYSLTSIRIPNDGNLHEIGNVSLQTMRMFLVDGWITAGSTICFLKVKDPVVEGSGYGPIIVLKGNVDCRLWPASYGVGVPAPMNIVIVNTVIQQWDGPGLYHNHWNVMRPSRHFEWSGIVTTRAWWHPVSGCFLAYEAWKFRQGIDASGVTAAGEVAWPQVGYSSGIYLPGCKSLFPAQPY